MNDIRLKNQYADSRLAIGMDIGSVAVKAALVTADGEVAWTCYKRHAGQSLTVAADVLRAVNDSPAAGRIIAAALTGAGAKQVSDLLDLPFVNEVLALVHGVRGVAPEVGAVIEIGGQDAKLIELGPTGHATGAFRDFALSPDCAAGTGSFLDQQASRLGLNIEDEFGELALKSTNPPRVAGRCSVFAKSDMIHLQQQATRDYDIVAGLCFGMARNLRATLAKGRDLPLPLAFCGGVASNAGMRHAMEVVFEVGLGNLVIPDHHAEINAIGTALYAINSQADATEQPAPCVIDPEPLIKAAASQSDTGAKLARLDPPQRIAPNFSEDEIAQQAAERFTREGKIPAFLGIDVGSLSTNLVVMATDGQVLAKRYLMTAGRPIEAVRIGLREVGAECGEHIDILGVGTTGSGRYLTGDFVGADLVANEITAQARGAAASDSRVDTIFEIGGQDSKFIRLRDGIVVDFEMNHACAAGTGSFLEEQAERLDISVKEEFSKLAFESTAPVRLGERCTVFMETDLLAHRQRGAQTKDLVAGLAYSIVHNYLNRVVGHHEIGKHILFQGGVAANHSVVAAFEAVTDRPVTVPGHHEVTGALGMAILAQQRRDGMAEPPPSTFRGFDLSERNYTIESFECGHCPNACEIKKVQIEGEQPLFYGARCDHYDVRDEQKNAADGLPDLFRERERLMLTCGHVPDNAGSARGVIGVPRSLFNYQMLPFFHTLLRGLGFEVIISPPTNKRIANAGIEKVLAQPCFPVKVAHGHVHWLIERGVDAIFLPSVIDAPKNGDDAPEYTYFCPYVQTIPYQANAAFNFRHRSVKLLTCPLRMSEGRRRIAKSLRRLFTPLGVSAGELATALDAAETAQQEFEDKCVQLGHETLTAIENANVDSPLYGLKPIILVSRPYNGCDPGVNLDLPKKLASLGQLAMPMDLLDLRPRISGPEPSRMFWAYGQRILAAGEIIRDNPRLRAIYLSNFSCGPDSFIHRFFNETLAGKPCLFLEIDEHSAPAGIITRLEAFLDSLASQERLKGGQTTEPPPKAKPIFTDHSTDGTERTIYIPNMSDQAYALAAAFRWSGMKAKVMDPSDESSLVLGRAHTSGKECLPCIITTGDMLREIRREGFDPQKAAFFMPSGTGPCRFGLYNQLHRLILRETGHENIPIFSPNQGASFYRDFATLHRDPTRPAWRGIVMVDLLTRALHHLRPYEMTPGATDAIYRECLDTVCHTIEQGEDIFRCASWAATRMASVKTDRSRPRPVIGIVGEIYVRSHGFSNKDIVRDLERLGGEARLASFIEWIYYTNYARVRRNRRMGETKSMMKNWLKNRVQKHDEVRLARPFCRLMPEAIEPPTRMLLDYADDYIHDSFEGEAALSVGKTIELCAHQASGIVNLMPFSCMPGTIVATLLTRVRSDHGNIPVLSIAMDGQASAAHATRLEAFVHQARQFMTSSNGET